MSHENKFVKNIIALIKTALTKIGYLCFCFFNKLQYVKLGESAGFGLEQTRTDRIGM